MKKIKCILLGLFAILQLQSIACYCDYIPPFCENPSNSVFLVTNLQYIDSLYNGINYGFVKVDIIENYTNNVITNNNFLFENTNSNLYFKNSFSGGDCIKNLSGLPTDTFLVRPNYYTLYYEFSLCESDIVKLENNNLIGNIFNPYENDTLNFSDMDFSSIENCVVSNNNLQTNFENIEILTNPFNQKLIFKSSINQNSVFQLIDINGKIIENGKVKLNNQINTVSLSKGIYILNIYDSNQQKIFSKKLMKLN